MVQLTLGTKRTALALYGVLLVLPTLVLGGLHWRQLVIDHETMLATVPGDAQDASRRLQDTIQSALRELVDREDERPFYEYKANFFPPGTLGTEIALVPSPIKSGPTPRAILGWFSFVRGGTPVVLVGSRRGTAHEEDNRNAVLYATLELKRRLARELPFLGYFRERKMREVDLSMPVLAINLSDEESIDCMRDELPALRGLQNEKRTIQVSAFHLRFYVESNGTPRIVATRKVTVPSDRRLAQMPSCFNALGRGVELQQGFFIDPVWFFRDLPATLAARVLDVSQVFVPMDAGPGAQDPSLESFTIHPVRALGFETSRTEDDDYGAIKVAVNVRDLEARFRTQSVRFLGVAAMLVVSLATGLILLMRSVNRDLEAARRTENFVAAVTHELRTPVSAIKLYGEMLQDGWVDDPEKLKEYYRRIVRECGRLETLVENVLEKSQLARRDIVPEKGDVNAIVESLAPSLKSLAPEGVADLEFQYCEDLPRVALIPEGVRSIVSNLVENARKYAPVQRNTANPEPIVVKTHVLAGNVVLDVMDRGPGIPHSERAKIFEAFYRMGNERTRTARGTGLGLHLVSLQCAAMRARVLVLDRQGGGSVFRVTFETHRDAPRAA